MRGLVRPPAADSPPIGLACAEWMRRPKGGLNMMRRIAIGWAAWVVAGGVALWLGTQLSRPQAARPEYGGSAACLRCHQNTDKDLVDAWIDSRHAQVRPASGASGMDLYRRVTGPGNDRKFVEAGVSCEACHGPGAAHVQAPSADNIVRPQELGYKLAAMVCGQCHARGETADGGDFPKGFMPGDDLLALFTLAEATKPNDLAEFNEFVQDRHYKRGLSCLSCHDPHGVGGQPAMLKAGGNDLCGRCHPGPARNVTAHNPAARADSTCVECHMPGGSHRFVSRAP